MKEGEMKLSEVHDDSYDRILEVFRHGDKQKARSISTLMDQSIEKSSMVITHHSMLIKGREYCKWIDENYMLVGKAKYFKYDFYPAIESFQYVAAQYPKEPTKYEALCYLVLCYTQTGNQLEAESIVDYLKNEKKIPANLKGFVAATCAHYYIKVKNYKNAIEQMNKAVVQTRRKAVRSRYMFILAQLYQKEEENQKSYDLYGQVLKMHPAYEMDFNAKINRARVIDMQSNGSDEIRKELLSMLKDGKNKDYFDQIYYALAGLAMKENNVEGAKELYLKSAHASMRNPNQKALSYLELGKIYFKEPNYRKAQLFYDSTAASLTKDHPDYDAVQNRKSVLSKLIKNLNTIAYEDSMQKLAKLTPQQLDKLVDKLIQAAIDEEERKKQEDLEQKGSNAIFTNTQSTTTTGGNQWYFYNSAAISFGMTEFSKKWGTRKLEDHWRRSNKQSESDASLEAGLQADSSDTSKGGIRDRARYTKNIPTSEKQIEASNTKIIDAYYGNAGIYREQLFDRKEAAKTLEDLLERYPDNRFKLQSYYQLYRMYADLGNESRSNYYKDLILVNHPESEYAKVIRNPNYLKEMRSDKQRVSAFYADTYNAYQSRNYEAVLKNKTEAEIRFPDSEMAGKFAMLRAMAIGNMRPVDEFEAALNSVVKEFPKDSVRFMAMDMLEYIRGKKSELSAIKKENLPIDSTKLVKKEEFIYSLNIDTLNYYVVAFEMSALNVELLKEKINTYNTSHFGANSYFVETLQYDNRNLLLKVKPLMNKASAEDYFKGISENADVFSYFKGAVYKEFLITAGNFNVFTKEKNLQAAINFFKANYLQ